MLPRHFTGVCFKFVTALTSLVRPAHARALQVVSFYPPAELIQRPAHASVTRPNFFHVCSTVCSLSLGFAMTFGYAHGRTKGDIALISARFARRHELLLNCFSVGFAVCYKWGLRQVMLGL